MKKFLFYFVCSVAVIELTGYVLALLNVEPTGFRLFVSGEWKDKINGYADRDSLLGVWHKPNDSWIQFGPCFTVNEKANQFGARDNKWDVSKKGMLFLGSSFIEGYGTDYGKRFSEKFEKLSGNEVFNCGMSGTFSPVQYYMTLKKFEHTLKFDTCFVFFILPNDEELVTQVEKKRYRPYLTDTGIAYTTGKKLFPEKKDTKEKLQLLFLQYSYTYHLYSYFTNRNFLKSRLLKEEESWSGWIYTSVTGVPLKGKDFPQTRRVMELFCKDYPGKFFYFILIPTLNSEPGIYAPPAANNMKLIDLRGSLNSKTDYFECNPHWNEKGNAKVAKALFEAVRKN